MHVAVKISKPPAPGSQMLMDQISRECTFMRRFQSVKEERKFKHLPKMYGGINFYGNLKYFVLEYAEYEVDEYLKLTNFPGKLNLKEI